MFQINPCYSRLYMKIQNLDTPVFSFTQRHDQPATTRIFNMDLAKKELTQLLIQQSKN